MDPHHTAIPWLQQQGFSPGLIKSLVGNAGPRIWVLDNSQSMHMQDARLVVQQQQQNTASRWQELQECVSYHVQLFVRLGTPIRFALLNEPGSGGLKYFGLNQSGDLAQEQRIIAQSIGASRPHGAATLATELKILRDYVASIERTVRANNHLVAIVIATQGLPTNEFHQTSGIITQEFVNVLQSFTNLPVSITIRMCSNDEQAIHFYNTLDSRLSFRFDVLDDWWGEALEVYLRNPWVTYALVLHRFRETGTHLNVLDNLDERLLHIREAANLCEFLFGQKLPDPNGDWASFLHMIDRYLRSEQQHWNPIHQRYMPWIDLDLFKSYYGGSFQQQRATTNQEGHVNLREGQSISTGVGSKKLPSSETELKSAVQQKWSSEPPHFIQQRSIEDLLTTMDVTFPLVPPHSYFQEKFHPFARTSLRSGIDGVLKRAVRKTRLFLHPDKLPRDFDRLSFCGMAILKSPVTTPWSVWCFHGSP